MMRMARNNAWHMIMCHLLVMHGHVLTFAKHRREKNKMATGISQIRYAGTYYGPSYGNPFDPSFEGFTSLQQARDRFTERQETSGVPVLDTLTLTVEDHMITHVSEESYRFPSTTADDRLELYRVTHGEIAAEPFTRFTATPRGIKREDF